MSGKRMVAAAVAIALVSVAPVAAQPVRSAFAPRPGAPAPFVASAPLMGVSEVRTSHLVTVGAVTGIIAMYGGALIGAYVGAGGGTDDVLPVIGAITGAWVVPALAIPLAVHVANDERGSFGATLGASLLGGAGGIALVMASRGEVTLIAPVVLELVASVWAEKKSTPAPTCAEVP